MNKLLLILFLFCSNVLFGQQAIKNLQWLNVDQEIEKLTADNGLTLYAETENTYDFIYGNPYLWKHLYEANKHNFIDDKNPHLIEIGQTLIIPPLRGDIREGTR